MLFLRAIKGRPDGLPRKETHHVNEIPFVTRKTMIDAFRERHEIALFDVDAHPTIFQITNIKETASVQDVSNFLRIVNVLQ